MLLSECVEAMEAWSEGGDLPPALASLNGGVLVEGDRETFAAGAAPLWVLGEQIDTGAMDETRLPAEGMAALGLAVLVRGRLLLAARRKDKPGLLGTAELAARLTVEIDPRSSDAAQRVLLRLRQLRDDLAARGFGTPASRVLKRAELEPVSPVAAPPSSQQTSVSPIWFVVLAVAVVAGLVSWSFLPKPSGGIAPPGAYQQLPIKTLSISRGRLVVRVEDGWIDLPIADREQAAVAFWEQVRAEHDDPGIAVEIQDRRTKLLAIVVDGRVTWKTAQPSR